MKPIREMHIEGLAIKEVPLTHNIHHRPFQFGGSTTSNVMDDINSLGDMVNTQLNHVTPGLVAKTIPSLLTIAPPIAPAHIPNGYNEARYSFILSVRIIYMGNRQEVLKVTGFSDNHDLLSANGSININMPLYMTSVIYMNGNDNRSVKLDHVSNVILPDNARTSSNEGQSISSISENTHSVQRPNDVFSNMIINQNTFEEGIVRLNTSDKLFNTAMPSDIINGDQFGYTSRVINSYNQSNADMEADIGASLALGADMSLYSGCHMHASDTSLTHNPFIGALNNTAEGATSGVFRISDLIALDPTFSVGRISIYKLSTSDMTDYRNYTVTDGDITIAAEVATAANFMILNVMERSGVHTAKLVMTNKSMDVAEPWLIDVLDGRPMNGIPVSAVGTMLSALYSELPPMLGDIFSGGMTLKIEASLLSETVITVSLDGYEEVTKAYPSYAANTYSPLIVPPNVDTMMYDGFTRVVDIIGTPPSIPSEPSYGQQPEVAYGDEDEYDYY